MSWVKQGKAGENRGVLFCICTVMMDGFARNGHIEKDAPRSLVIDIIIEQGLFQGMKFKPLDLKVQHMEQVHLLMNYSLKGFLVIAI